MSASPALTICSSRSFSMGSIPLGTLSIRENIRVRRLSSALEAAAEAAAPLILNGNKVVNETEGRKGRSREHLLREQVEPLLLGDGFLSEQLENDGSHRIPLVLKLQGALVLEERYGTGGMGGGRGRSGEKGGVWGEKQVRDDSCSNAEIHKDTLGLKT
ncbi:hypothetical protein EYF80_012057 [Liparis tanakae]|uniref:Uncharacterized protein n=1 Tax=Liparis tanakae TaxID=230148 RepID=A0A4Z2IIC2_9TELE|nr:hypothetical protein EYF80_012057 [Liparis tanakae]